MRDVNWRRLWCWRVPSPPAWLTDWSADEAAGQPTVVGAGPIRSTIDDEMGRECQWNRKPPARASGPPSVR